MLVPVTNAPRDYAWGSPVLIPNLQGRTPSGVVEAEVWFGDHPGSPAHVPDGRTLADVLAERGEAPLPYLVKLLAAGTSLSIQAHPSKAQAAAGFAREESAGIPRDAPERTYRDDNHKPEIILAVSDRFRALVGLRPLAATRRLVDALGEGARSLTSRLSGGDDADVLRAVLAWALTGEADGELPAIATAIESADATAVGEFAEEIDVLQRIAADFPGDPGLVVALLMNLVVLRRGEALFAPAGALHAYQDGLGVEVMAASDNVLRGGLTPKHIDVAELLSIVDTTPGPAPLVTPLAGDGMAVFDVGIPDFSVLRAQPTAGSAVRIALAGPAMLVATDGALTVTGATGAVALSPGTAAFATADEGELQVAGYGTAYVAVPGRS
jgi:mannose-6-phosphate isomerase